LRRDICHRLRTEPRNDGVNKSEPKGHQKIIKTACVGLRGAVGVEHSGQMTRARRPRRFARFDEFWVAYLRAHANPKTALFHVAGVGFALLLLAAMLSCGMVFFAACAVVPAQLGAFLGHWLTGEPDTVSPNRPDWAAIASLRMFWLAITGRLDATVRDARVHMEAPYVPR
jgi:hypothetical protein